MPLIENSTFSPPLLLRNRHIQTCIPTLFRRVRNLTYQREKLITPDNDFLDLDWSRIGSRKLVVVSHGLEGSSNGIYVRGLVRTMNEKGWDALACNFCGCDGEPNTKIYNYHSGKSEDLESVVAHALSRNYAVVGLVGFSVGGNITLKYLAEHTHSLPKEVQAGWRRLDIRPTPSATCPDCPRTSPVCRRSAWVGSGLAGVLCCQNPWPARPRGAGCSLVRCGGPAMPGGAGRALGPGRGGGHGQGQPRVRGSLA